MRGRIRNYLFILVFIVVFGLFAVGFVSAANEIIDFNLNKNLYAPGEEINISGKVFDSLGEVNSANITISINGTDSYALTDSSGIFSASITAPLTEGVYDLTISYGDAIIVLKIKVSLIDEIQLAIIYSASEAMEALIFQDDMSSVGIDDYGTIPGDRLYANFTNNGTTYYAIVQKDTGESEYNTLFISDLKDFSSDIKFQYLIEGSKIGLNSINYEVFFIDPSGSKAFLLKTIEPVFYGEEDYWAKLFILALNSSGNVLTNLTSITLEQYNNLGESEDITNDSEGAIQVYLSGSGGNYGFATQSLLISENGGIHNLIAEGIQHISYFVEKFTLNFGVETTDGTKISNARAGDQVVLKASVIDLDTGAATDEAEVSAIVISPDGSEASYTLEANENKQFVADVTLDESLTGEYSVIFTADYSGVSIKKKYRFSVKSYDLFMKAFSPGKGKGDFIPPNSNGYIIVGGKDIVNETFADLESLTDNCDSSLIYLTGIFNDKNENNLINFSTMTLSELYGETGAPDWVQEEIENYFGSGACAIKFYTPSQTGGYRLEVISNISGEIITIKDYMEVSSMFAYGMPADCTTGSFSESVQPGAYICFKVNAYDSVTGQQIDPSNISDINIIEIYSQSEGVITDQITNISLKEFSDNSKGFTFKTSSASLGYHFVKFRIKATTSVGETTGNGNSWFMTELWKVWAFPYCSCSNMFCSFGGESNINLRVEAFTAGFGSGKEGLTVTVSSVKNFDLGETISISSEGDTSCTTANDNSSSEQNSSSSQSGGKVSPAYCTLTIPKPVGGWNSGDYEVKLTATDSDENSMEFYSWFRVENFRFWVWNRNWEITSAQDAVFDITLQSFNNQPILANVSISKVYYMGSEDMWMSPKEINISSSIQQINGTGSYILSSGNLSGLKPGFYDIVFNAVSGSGSQTTRAGFNLRSFVVFTDATNQNWERSYEKNGNLTINVSAFDSVNWSTWPPTGDSHNIKNISVVRIIKNGMWDFPYKARGKDVIGESDNCDGITGNCILTVPLTNFDQSQYDITIEVTDSLGATSQTNFWFKTETYSLTIPEIQDWRTVPTSNKLTDTMEVTLSTDATCGTSSDSVEEPANVTSCLFDSNNRLPTINGNDGVNNDLRTVFLLDKTNVSAPKLYVNYQNDTWINGMQAQNNFSAAQAGPLGINDSFIDANGYNWNINQIDTGLGKIKLKFIDGIVMSRTNMASGEGQTENSVEYPSLYIVNKSLSQSSIFLYSGSSGWEDKFWDDEWAQIDLDADGLYNCNNGTCEEYFMLLADSATSGVYDTLLMSPTRNMTAGIDSYNGFSGSGTGDIRFNESAYPIYLLNLIYSETNGIGRYRLVTTTNKAGWPGRNLGVYQLGDEDVKIPVMVSSPSTKAGIANKVVVIDKLRSFGTMNYEEYPLSTPAIANTSSNGIALLSVNMSGIESGQYSVIMQVNDSGTIIKSTNDWDNPTIEMRGFSISNLFGVKATIDSMVEWSESAGNLIQLNSAEGSLGSNTLRLQCGNNELNDANLCHVDDWRFKELWVNATSNPPTVLKDSNPYDWYLWNSDISEDRWNLNDPITVNTDFGGQMTYVITNISLSSRNEPFIIDTPRLVHSPGSPCDFDITILSVIPDTSFTWDVYQSCPWSSDSWAIEIGMTHYINEPVFLWGLFNVSSIIEGNATGIVTLNQFVRTIELSSPVSSEDLVLEDRNDGRVRVVTNALETGYDLYFYNSNLTKTRDDLENRSSNSLDRMAVVNSSSDVVANVPFGEPITGLDNELDGKALVQADPWNFYVYLSNLSINGKYIYPLPWACDGKTFYVASFTEEELGTRMYDCGEAEGELSSNPNYLILFDSMCDGVWAITNAKFDDDPVLDDSWANIGGNNWVPYDFDHVEEGSVNMCNNPNANQSESWIDIGRESWPISITNYNTTLGQVDLFKSKWNVQPDENLSLLTLWVQTKNFDGTLINGNISLSKLAGKSYNCGMMQEEEIFAETSDGNLVSGIGYLNINLSNVTSSDLTFKFKVQDETDINKFENIVKQIWYGPGQQNMGGGGGGGGGVIINAMAEGDGGGCGDMFKGPSGGGGGGGSGGGGYEMDPEKERCMANEDNETCAAANCAWIGEGYFDALDPPMCGPCPAFDDDKDSCDTATGCQWIPAGGGGTPGTGICDPVTQ